MQQNTVKFWKNQSAVIVIGAKQFKIETWKR